MIPKFEHERYCAYGWCTKTVLPSDLIWVIACVFNVTTKFKMNFVKIKLHSSKIQQVRPKITLFKILSTTDSNKWHNFNFRFLIKNMRTYLCWLHFCKNCNVTSPCHHLSSFHRWKLLTFECFDFYYRTIIHYLFSPLQGKAINHY